VVQGLLARGERWPGRWSSLAGVLAAASIPWLSGCSSDEDDCGASIGATVSAFVPGGQPVHCRNAKGFPLQGRVVRLTHAEYGAERDCPSGCFSSHVCAIEDPSASGPALFYAAWNSTEEAPLGIENECPGSTSGGETWPDCVPSGLRHPLVASAEFRSFADDEAGSGPFRWCVNRYAEGGNGGTWPKNP
jgi:hypothetical protein